MQHSSSAKVVKFSSSKKSSRMEENMKEDSRKRNKVSRGKNRYFEDQE